MRHAHEYPTIGTWYIDVDRKEKFEVIAKDEKDGTIEIQSFSGEIEELDNDTWFAMQLVAIAPPKDWSGPFEVDKDEFSELGDEIIHPYDYSKPFGNLPDS